MTLTNRKMLMIWVGLVALVLVIFTLFSLNTEKHPMSAMHNQLRHLGKTVSYVLEPVSEETNDEVDNDGLVALTVKTSPPDANVRIMNITPVYQPGMALEPGDYDVEVSAPGYQPSRRWVTIAGMNASPTFNLKQR